MRMKVVEVDDVSRDFAELDAGSVFRYGNDIFVKINGGKDNAVNLRTWELMFFASGNSFARVVPVGAELRIGVDV